jgi:hypothetical protein
MFEILKPNSYIEANFQAVRETMEAALCVDLRATQTHTQLKKPKTKGIRNQDTKIGESKTIKVET